MANRGAKGRRAEWRSRDWLQSQGYEVVRAAGSKGAFDLVAWNDEEILLVNVKCNCWAPPMERLAMSGTVAPPNARRVMHRWDDRARAPRVQELEAA